MTDMTATDVAEEMLETCRSLIPGKLGKEGRSVERFLKGIMRVRAKDIIRIEKQRVKREARRVGIARRRMRMAYDAVACL